MASASSAKATLSLLVSFFVLFSLIAFGFAGPKKEAVGQPLRSGISPSPTPTPSPQETDTILAPEEATRISTFNPIVLMPLPREPNAEDYLDGGLGTNDVDCDGIKNIADNCVLVYNPDQRHSTSDEYGDACNPNLRNSREIDQRCADTDTDGDGIFDNKDNCNLVPNPDQKDRNKNGIGDACEKSTGHRKRSKASGTNKN